MELIVKILLHFSGAGSTSPSVQYPGSTEVKTGKPDSCKIVVFGKWNFMNVYSHCKKFLGFFHYILLILLGSAAHYCKRSKTKSRGQGMLRKVLQGLDCICAHTLIQQRCKYIFTCLFQESYSWQKCAYTIGNCLEFLLDTSPHTEALSQALLRKNSQL